MNEVLKVLKERRSIRAFRPEPLKKEDLDAIVEAGLYAPSAKNLQSTKLVVVRDAAVLARLERLNSRILGTPEGTPFYGAPEAIVVLSDSEYPNWLQDGSLVPHWASAPAGSTGPWRPLNCRRARLCWQSGVWAKTGRASATAF